MMNDMNGHKCSHHTPQRHHSTSFPFSSRFPLSYRSQHQTPSPLVSPSHFWSTTAQQQMASRLPYFNSLCFSKDTRVDLWMPKLTEKVCQTLLHWSFGGVWGKNKTKYYIYIYLYYIFFSYVEHPNCRKCEHPWLQQNNRNQTNLEGM